jgi:hypothetical protein
MLPTRYSYDNGTFVQVQPTMMLGLIENLYQTNMTSGESFDSNAVETNGIN